MTSIRQYIARCSLLVAALVPAIGWAQDQDAPIVACDGEPPMQWVVSFVDRISLDAVMRDQKAAFIPASVPLSGDIEIDALRNAGANAFFDEQLTEITYSFYSDAVFGGDYYGDETGVHEVSESLKENYREIFAKLGQLLSIDFVEITEMQNNIGDIRIMNSDGPDYAYAYYPTSLDPERVSADIHYNPSFDRLGDTNGFQHPAGYHGYMTLVHELGHALGMKHPHEHNPRMPEEKDETVWTVMSYVFQDITGGSSAASFMLLDMKFLHHAYDYAIADAFAGDSTIAILGEHADRHDQLGDYAGTQRIRQILFNDSGENTVDLGDISAGQSYHADFRHRGWIARADQVGDYGIMVADGTVLHRVVAGPGSTNLYAGQRPMEFTGYQPGRTLGDDQIHATGPGDVINLGYYSPSQCVESQDGDDALFTMADDSSSVRVVDYHAMDEQDRPHIIRPRSRFIEQADGVVLDTVTGLQWHASASYGDAAVDWDTAVDHALDSSANGYDDWRLPHRNELLSVIDLSINDGPVLPQDHPFSDPQAALYWTSSNDPADDNQAWAVDFSDATANLYDKEDTHWVWLVRGGTTQAESMRPWSVGARD